MTVCKKCGSTFSLRQCPVCKKHYMMLWRIKNSERVADVQAEYAQCNKAAIRENARGVYSENPEHFRNKTKKYKGNNPERTRAANLEWKRANPDKVKEAIEGWRQSNPEKIQTYRVVRSGREQVVGVGLSPGLKVKVLLAQGGECKCCGCDVFPGELDHILPLALGGVHHDWNMQVLCRPCNASKGKKLYLDFLIERAWGILTEVPV